LYGKAMEAKNYMVRVSGELDEIWKAYFAPFVYSHTASGETVFTGTFKDQSELIDALNRFQSVNVPIVSIITVQGDNK
jgi:hypothetical protein